MALTPFSERFHTSRRPLARPDPASPKHPHLPIPGRPVDASRPSVAACHRQTVPSEIRARKDVHDPYGDGKLWG